jgi:predicted DCC family thiol-disulfide oxidoreductase YuxK
MGERGPLARAPVAGADGPVVLFDGLCHLCSAVVQFAIARDPRARLRFAPLQSSAAARLLEGLPARGEPIPDSFVLIEHGRLRVRSSAALRLVRLLTMPWPLLAALVVVPRPLRDWAYDALARRRTRWFGVRTACFVPTPEIRARFLDSTSVKSPSQLRYDD